MKYYLGLDIGGTKTIMRLEDENKKEIGQKRGLTGSSIGQHVQSGIKLLEKASILPKFKYMKEFIED